MLGVPETPGVSTEPDAGPPLVTEESGELLLLLAADEDCGAVELGVAPAPLSVPLTPVGA